MTTPDQNRAAERDGTWRPGDRCVLVDLRRGDVLDGEIEVIRGHKMVVQTHDGRRWWADVDSSFVQRPKPMRLQ